MCDSEHKPPRGEAALPEGATLGLRSIDLAVDERVTLAGGCLEALVVKDPDAAAVVIPGTANLRSGAT